MYRTVSEIFGTPERRNRRQTSTWRNASDLHFRVRRPSFWLQMSILPITFCVYRGRQSHYQRSIQQTDCVGFAALWLFILRDFHHCRRAFNKSEFAIDVHRELFILFQVCRFFAQRWPPILANYWRFLWIRLRMRLHEWMHLLTAVLKQSIKANVWCFLFIVNLFTLSILSSFTSLSKAKRKFYDWRMILHIFK